MCADIFGELRSVHLPLPVLLKVMAPLDHSQRRSGFCLAHVACRRKDEYHKLVFMAKICFLFCVWFFFLRSQLICAVGLQQVHTASTEDERVW